MVAIHPPIAGFLAPDRADELVAIGLLADDAAGLRAAWPRNVALWDEAVAGARAALPEERLHERVGGEWSFVETLRHLVFVTDTWIGEVVEERPSPLHPWGVPPDFAAGSPGIDPDASPSLDEVLAVRAERTAQVAAVLAAVDDAGLARRCAPREGRFTVCGALQCVLFEEWAHRRYAERDLAVLLG